jgi:D-glycero-beta-D-manno-heptose-7-phosphate kinase
MNNEQERLISLVDSFQGTPMLVVGDCILDHYIWGKVNRISPEAPVVVVEVTEEDKRPGGAGNVANNLVALGSSVSMCGIIGDDVSGKEMLELLNSSGITTDSIIIDSSRPTTMKTRVIAHAQQVVRVDREKVVKLEKPYVKKLCDAVSLKLKNIRGIVISDYAKGAIVPELFNIFQQARAGGVFGNKNIPILVDPKHPNFSFYTGVTVIKPNRMEAQEASGIQVRDSDSAIDAGRLLLEKWDAEMVLITLGEDGMALISKTTKDALHIHTKAREVYDVSGAGDTVSAVFTLALSVGATAQEAAELANIAAGIVVAEVGTVAVSADQLRQAILDL